MRPMPTNPDVIACVLRLDAVEGAALERTQGHRAHGLFMELIRHSDPELAAALHAPAAVKPFTVAPLQGAARRLRPGSSYTLRVTLLRGELFPPFVRSFLQPELPRLQIGEAGFALREALVTPDSHLWADVDTWAGLLEGARPVEELTLHFVTPAAFTIGAERGSQKQIGLFPEPGAVFGSLLRRWNALAPEQLPADLLERVEALPSRYQLHTEMLQFAKSPQVGFVGYCSYRLRGAPDDLRRLHALARAAFYLGIGYKTTQGMGVARAEPT